MADQRKKASSKPSKGNQLTITIQVAGTDGSPPAERVVTVDAGTSVQDALQTAGISLTEGQKLRVSGGTANPDTPLKRSCTVSVTERVAGS